MTTKTFSIDRFRQRLWGASAPTEGDGVPGELVPDVPATVEHAVRLAPGTLLLAGRFGLEASEAGRGVTPHADAPAGDVGVHYFPYGTGRGLLLLDGPAPSLEGLHLDLGDGRRVEADEIARAATDLQTLLRRTLAGETPDVRHAAIAFFATAMPPGGKASRPLSASLHRIRETLRERLPYCEIACDQPQGMHVDALFAVDDCGYYAQGWVRDGEADLVGLTAESPEGCRAELLDHLVRVPRPDVEELYGPADDPAREDPGFSVFFQTHFAGTHDGGWIFEMRNSSGVARQTPAPPVVRDAGAVRTALLQELARRMPRADRHRLLEHHLYPALRRLQERHRERVQVDDVAQFGAPPSAPDVSIVVPLYGRVDFVEQQMAHFVHDAAFAGVDLIYVLDSPELAGGLRRHAAQLHRLYRVPFRLATLNRNGGFSAANNLGASLARGRLLLLLNSDVLPDAPGWLGTMTAFYDATPQIGALGPKLLFEDDSLQHAGLYFSRLPDLDEWENQHYFKGFHRRLPAANVARTVPAVTAACLMIDRGLYEDLGGLRGLYVQGDYEDSDLCLRLHATGLANWYLPDVALYHLEGQSYPSSLRQLTTRYNRWLHTYLWGDHIAALMADAGRA